MCGIAGYYTKNQIDRSRFEEMVDMIEHRGPNDRGTYYNDFLALGHRRLSIIDLSMDGHQPFFYKDRYVLVYNGEVYNYRELREDLKTKHNYVFNTATDTEVLIAAYDCYKEECVKYFNGMWSFAIYDKVENKLFCSRDRFGVKPFYYYASENEFIFGSEIKQVLHMANHQFSVNRKRMLEYLIRGIHDYTEETLVAEVYQLRGGCNLSFDCASGEISIKRYYDLSKIKQTRDDFTKVAEEFKKVFTDSVRLRLRADVPLGYCLSGGLDSSSIVCVADKIINDEKLDVKQEAVSSCFEDKRYDEQEYIDEVIGNTSVNSNKIFPSGNVFEIIDKMVWYMDEPFSSTSQYAQWSVFKGAKDCNLTVMLDGQGADEQLAGYTGFYSVIMADCLRHFRFKSFAHELKCYKKLRASTEKHVKSYKIIVEAIISAYLPRKLQQFGKLHAFYLKKGRMPFEPEDIKKTIYGINLYPANNFRKYILDQIDCNLAMLLHYEDRNSMAHSIESRVPFVDYKLAELMYSLPIEYKIKDGITKYVLRESLDGILPDKIKNRYSKLGFVTPEDQWFNDNKEMVRKEIEEACEVLSPIIKRERVMDWYNRIDGKIARRDFIPWHLICASHWVKVFNLKV